MRIAFLFLLAPLAALTAADVFPPDVAAAKSRYTADLAALEAPFIESYAWQLESAMRADSARSNTELLRAIDAELQRIGATKSDPFPPRLQGLWLNNKTTPFEGRAIAITPDGRAFLVGTMDLGAIRVRYFAAERVLRATVLGPEGDKMLQGKAFMTIEAQLDPDEKAFTIKAIKSIMEDTGMKNERFSHTDSKLPEEVQKLLK